MSENKNEMAVRTTILRGLVGSTIHGLNVQDGLEDRDEMGVCVEDIDHVVGFNAFEQYIYRSAAEREGSHDAKSRAGDLDLVIYSLRKYLSLALKGNPTVMNLLFVPADQCVVRMSLGAQLQELSPLIVSRHAGNAFLGYLHAQRQRLQGVRGQKDVNRPELVAKFGYDTKYAMHMLRLGYQGIELLETGRLSLPMQEPVRSLIFDVRNGQHSQQFCLDRASELEDRLRTLLTTSPLRKEPDRKAVEDWMVSVYYQQWKSREQKFPLSQMELETGRKR